MNDGFQVVKVVEEKSDTSDMEAYSQNPKDDSCDGVDCGLEC